MLPQMDLVVSLDFIKGYVNSTPLCIERRQAAERLK
jgi:hypothetical protein